MKHHILIFSLLPLVAFTANEQVANEKENEEQRPFFKATELLAPFLEQFVEGWDQRWFPSDAIKEAPPGTEDITLYRYTGKWSVEEPSVNPAIQNDSGLVVKTQAAHHAISALFADPIDPKDKDLIVQYEVKAQENLNCGGAYLKLLTKTDEQFEPKSFDDKTPYTIMFGPDKCGTTDKVHFIFRHKNPKTGQIVEHHLKDAPSSGISTQTTLYTLVVHPNNQFEIKVNNEVKKSGSLLTDFEPPVNPPAKIDDPTDVKPSDWVDIKRIPDPNAVKPEDWDDEAPRYIPDESAEMPKDWLVDEPLEIPDPESKKPEDWSDEDDGEWMAPTIPNPICDNVSGCGKWERPNIPNPNFKGVWSRPFIDNPEYKGEWKARQIDNPDYFEDKNPSKFEPISAIGFEIWTMQNDILFDNIIISQDRSVVEKFTEETFKVKRSIEKKNAPQNENELPPLDSENEKGLLTLYGFSDQMRNLFRIAFLERNVFRAIQEEKLAAGVIGGILGLWLLFIFRFVLSTDEPKLDMEELKSKIAEREKKIQELEEEEEKGEGKKEEKKEEVTVIKSSKAEGEHKEQSIDEEKQEDEKLKQRKMYHQLAEVDE